MSSSGQSHYGALEKSVMHGKMDRRALRTRRSLHEALIGLIKERDYDQISVMDVADAANVGRSTFYPHFTDKDDLLRSGTVHFRELLLQDRASAELLSEDPNERLLSFSRFMTEHLRDQQLLYKALVRGRAGPIIMERFRLYICEVVRADLAPEGSNAKRNSEAELTVQFVVGAFMSMLTWWLDRGAREDPKVIHRAFTTLVLKGIGALG